MLVAASAYTSFLAGCLCQVPVPHVPATPFSYRLMQEPNTAHFTQKSEHPLRSEHLLRTSAITPASSIPVHARSREQDDDKHCCGCARDPSSAHILQGNLPGFARCPTVRQGVEGQPCKPTYHHEQLGEGVVASKSISKRTRVANTIRLDQ